MDERPACRQCAATAPLWSAVTAAAARGVGWLLDGGLCPCQGEGAQSKGQRGVGTLRSDSLDPSLSRRRELARDGSAG